MQTKTLLLGLATLSLLGALVYFSDDGSGVSSVPPHAVDAFNQFVRKYDRKYLSMSERDYRLRVFHDNLQYIAEHNQKGLGYTLGVNKFADLTFEEFDKAYLRQGPTPNTPFDGPLTFKMIGEKNWLKEGKVTPVKDQGKCGDCYAFGALSSFESALAIKHNKHIIVSEKEIIDCSEKYGNDGCKGGHMDQTFKYIIHKSISTIEDYPYKPVVEKCSADRAKTRYTMKHFSHISPTNMDGLLKAVDKQPVSICFDCRRDFHLYERGVYKGEPDCGTKRNHCLLIFGYGTDPDTKEEFTYMKNSWGNDWGEAGYVRFLLKGGSGTCGIANFDAIYPVLD